MLVADARMLTVTTAKLPPYCLKPLVESYCKLGCLHVQVGWRRSGLAVWSASGCRLMCSLRQTARPNTFTPLSAASSSAFATDSLKPNALPMEVRASALLPYRI